jgi:hypothetical protein
MASSEKDYPYRTNKKRLILPGIVLAALAPYFYHEARTGTKGVVIDLAIHLTAAQAHILFWALAAICAAGAGLILVTLIVPQPADRRVVLTDMYLIPPASAVRTPDKVRYADIKRLTVLRTQRTLSLYIRHRSGRVSLNAAAMESHEAFYDLLEELARRAPGAVRKKYSIG